MTTDAYGQPKKSTSPWVWVGLGCSALLLALIGFVAFILFVVFGAMRSSVPYKDALAHAQTDPRVVELLGSPVRPGYFFTGSINTQNDSGNADLTIPISGPKGAGILEVRATKASGQWNYERMRVLVKETKVNLLEESPGKDPPAE
jgi:hypothetical protein